MDNKERKKRIFIQTKSKLIIVVILTILINFIGFQTSNRAFIKKYNKKESTAYYLYDYEESSLSLKLTNFIKKEKGLLENLKSTMDMNKMLLDNFYVGYKTSPKTEVMEKEFKEKKEAYFKSLGEVEAQKKKIKKLEQVKVQQISVNELKSLKNFEYKYNEAEKGSIKKKMFERGMYFFLFSLTPFLLLLEIKKKDTHGSARWAKISDLGDRKTEDDDVDLLVEKGVTLGRFNGITLYDNSNTHLLVCAPTRSGKGVGVIIPSLVHSWTESAVVLDIKGENQVLTAEARRRNLNNKAITLFLNDRRSIGYNPLEEIKFNTSFEQSNARSIAEIIVSTGASGSLDFWETSALDYLTGIMLYCLYTIGEEKNGEKRKANLYDVVNFFSQNKVQKIAETLINKPILSELEAYNLRNYYPIETELIDKGIHPFVNKIMIKMANEPEKTFGGQLATLKTKMSVFEQPEIVNNLSKSEFSIRDIANYKKPVTLYIRVNSDEIPILKSVINIFVAQLVNGLMNNKEFEKSIFKNTNRTLILLDEFSQLERAKAIEDTITFSAGYGLKYVIILQNLEQLEKNYTKNNPFVGNCQVQLFNTPDKMNMAKELSEILGDKTLKVKNRTSAGNTRSSISSSYISRRLLTPDEVMRYTKKKSMLKIGNKPIVSANKIRYFKEKFYMSKIVEDVNVKQDKL